MFARNRTAKQSLTAYDPLPLELASSVGGNLTISEDGGYIVIGNNITRVRIVASLQFNSSEVKQHTMLIRLLRDGTASTLATVNVYGLSSSAEKEIYQYVHKGDKIYVTSINDAVLNSTSAGGSRSGLIVEKIV